MRRSGVPLVEDGSAALDPYEPWLAARVDSAAVLVATCEAASDASLGERRREILRPCPPTLVAAGILTQTACRIQRAQTGPRVEFALPIPLSAAVKQALAVRVLDAVRSAGRRPGVRARAGMTFADLAAARGVPPPPHHHAVVGCRARS